MIARLIYLIFGHRRGKRISPTHVRCPRCGREAERPERNKAAV